MVKRFYYDEKDFYLDGEKIVLHSGAIHYFRVHEQDWQDRLLKLKECGLNCVETYVPWNLHEPQEGSFDFSKGLDLGAYIDLAMQLGLYVIVRSGPYICAEWEGGGLPYWLLRYENMQIRCSNMLFMEKAERYLEKVCEIIKPRLIENGGNIVMLQIENEYGSYGNDQKYLQALKAFYEQKIPECVLFTADGLDISMLRTGLIDGVLFCGNFGSETEKNIAIMQETRPLQPQMCMEFWCGWFDHWGGKHISRSTQEKIACIEEFLKSGWSFNIYMFHGGTNFGFMSGMNSFENGKVEPTTTSYDYDAFLTESGDRTESYYALRELMRKYGAVVPKLTAVEQEKKAYGAVRFIQQATLFENLETIGKAYTSITPLQMEDMEQAYGYILYRTKTPFGGRVILEGLADRALVYANGEYKGAILRGEEQPVWLTPLEDAYNVDVLVENRGRINYGSWQLDKKGIQKMRMGGQCMFHFDCVSLPMDNLEKLQYTDSVTVNTTPCFYKGVFTVTKRCDTFLKPSGFSRGFAVLNGFNLGRFNNVEGPQRTLYVPKSLLKDGENELIIFDSDGAREISAEFTAQPEYDTI